MLQHRSGKGERKPFRSFQSPDWNPKPWIISSFTYNVPLVCFVQVEGSWFGFALLFVPVALEKESRTFPLLNPPLAARSVPGKVHLLWETKTWGRQAGAAAQPCCPIPHPGEGTNPSQAATLLGTFPLHLPGKRKCHSLLLRALFYIQIILPGHRDGLSPPATAKVSMCVPQLEENTGNTNRSQDRFPALFYCKFKWPWRCEALSFILKAGKVYSTQKSFRVGWRTTRTRGLLFS